MSAKREPGYLVTLQVFVPVDQKSVDDQFAKSQIVRNANAGDTARLMEFDVVKFDSRFTSRVKPEQPSPAGETATPPGLHEQDGKLVVPAGEHHVTDTIELPAGAAVEGAGGSGEGEPDEDTPPAGSPASRARKREAVS